MVLTVSSRSMRKRGGNGATPALFETKMWEMHLREHDGTYFGSQPAKLYTRHIRKNCENR